MRRKTIDPRLLSSEDLKEKIIQLVKNTNNKETAIRKVEDCFSPRLFLLEIFEYPNNEFLINVRVRPIEGFQQFTCSR
jgi:hypothetical protein